MQPLSFSRVPRIEWLVFGFLLFAVLWRGGKSLEATWMLVAVSTILVLAEAMGSSKKMENGKLPVGRSLGEGWNIENFRFSLRILAWGFFFWTTLSYFFSTTGNYGLDEVLRDGALVLMLLWTMRHARGESGALFVHRFIQTMTVAAVLGALFGLMVYVLQPVNRFVGTFFDHRFHTDYWPNAWAEFVLLAWPMVVLWMGGKGGRGKLIGSTLLGVVIGTLLLSYSRGAMIAFGGQIILLAVWEFFQRNVRGELRIDPSTSSGGKLKMTVVKIAIVLAAAIGLFIAGNEMRAQFHPVLSIGEKLTFTADEGGSSVDERKQFWAQSMQLIAERPLLGWGPYSFRFVHQRLQTTVLATSDHPHNVFLKLAAERGMPAAILFIALLLFILVPTVKLLIVDYKESQSQIIHRQSQMLFLVALLGVLAHNLIDFNLQFVGIALPFWMMLGVLAGTNEERTINKVKIMNTKFVQKLELSIAVILLTVAVREGAFLVTSSFGRHAESRDDFVTALRWYDRSAGEWFSRDMHLSRALLSTMRGETQRAQETMDIFLRLNAEDPRGWRLQGDIVRTKGDSAAAVEAYGKAYERGKGNDLSITLALAEVLGENMQLEGSKEQWSISTLKPEMDALLASFVEAIVHNEHFVALSHNAEDAIALSALLAEEFPDSAPRYEVLAARADFAMRSERAKVKSRPAGYLW